MISNLRFGRLLQHGAAAGLLIAVAACGRPDLPQGNQPLVAEVAPSQLSLELTGTGFFVDNDGHVLTANHAADGCARIYVEKEGRTLPATVVAHSQPDDLAVLKIRETLGLPAVFARTALPSANDLVFAASYQTLQTVIARGGSLFNAVVSGRKDPDPHDDLELVSDATHGASGAPVLNAEGLVIGVITHREPPDRVLATNVGDAKTFLAHSHIAFEQDDQPQVSPLQDRSHRAETISASVVCFKRG